MQLKQDFENICSDWQQQQQSYNPLLMERGGNEGKRKGEEGNRGEGWEGAKEFSVKIKG